MTIAEWLAAAKADAEKRGLPELIPMLEGLPGDRTPARRRLERRCRQGTP